MHLITILWIIYIGIIGTNTFISVWNGGYKTILAKLDLTFSLVSLIGLVGYVVGYDILNQEFWKTFFVLWILWEVSYTLVVFRRVEKAPAINIIVIYIMLSPVYYGVFKYAFLA